MKVIHLISGGDTGGAKTHVHSLLQGLNKHIKADMVCFTDGPFVEEARQLGISVDVIKYRNLISVLKPLRKKIVEGGYDIIHCHGARGNLMGTLMKYLTGLPVVTTVHSDPKLDYMGRPLSRLVYGTLNAWALRRIPYHIGVSDAMVNMLIDRGFNPQLAYAIYNGLNFDLPEPPMTRSIYLTSLGLDWPEDSVIVGIAARLNPVKDIPTLLRGFAAAYKKQPKLRLIIAGDGQDEAMLKALAQELGVAKEVCFAGWVSDTLSFYNALDINALTSLSETFPYALTEGARFSLPTVATRVGGVPYLIEHGVTGLLLEARDHETLARHLAALAADPNLRRTLGTQLLHKAKTDFSLESTIRRQLEIYKKMLDHKKRPKRDGVVICGAYGRGNAGDDAILEAIVSEMRSIDPDMPITVMSRNPKATKLEHRVNSFFIFNLLKMYRSFRKAKLYINGGGSLIQDVTSSRSLFFYLYTLRSAKKRGANVMMYGCGIGPLLREQNIRLASRILSKYVDIITLREDDSLQTLREMHVKGPRISLSADPALTLKSAHEQRIVQIMQEEGLDPNESYLCLSMRPWANVESIIDAVAACADYAYEAYGMKTVFLPIELPIDLAVSEKVAAKMKHTPHIIRTRYTASETIGLMARMRAVMAMRLHALVFAATTGVPIAGIVYDKKVSGFIKYLGQSMHTSFEDATKEKLCGFIDTMAALPRDALKDNADRLRALEAINVIKAENLLV